MRDKRKHPFLSSYLYLLRLPRGVSITTLTSPLSGSRAVSRLKIISITRSRKQCACLSRLIAGKHVAWIVKAEHNSRECQQPGGRHHIQAEIGIVGHGDDRE